MKSELQDISFDLATVQVVAMETIMLYTITETQEAIHSSNHDNCLFYLSEENTPTGRHSP